jgi:hypothetical protein
VESLTIVEQWLQLLNRRWRFGWFSSANCNTSIKGEVLPKGSAMGSLPDELRLRHNFAAGDYTAALILRSRHPSLPALLHET